MTLAEKLAEYAVSIKYEDIPAQTVQEAKKRIVDAMACAIGAFDARPIEIARRVAGDFRASNGSLILETRFKVPSDLATFVNGLMIRYFDFNDTYLSKEPAHPSDNLGECLSVASSMSASGKDLLLSLILAYEIQCRLCDAADIRHRGWDHVCYGLVSSAVATGKLMRLDKEKIIQAINIALNSHIAMRQVRLVSYRCGKHVHFQMRLGTEFFQLYLPKRG